MMENLVNIDNACMIVFVARSGIEPETSGL